MDELTTSPGSGDRSEARTDQAVVIGASMTGLLVARVLSEHFDHVLVVERDRLPAGPSPRAGLPQARHVHIFLLRGQRILEQRFAGIQAELTAAGAPWLSLTNDFGIFQNGAWMPRFASNYHVYTCSRDLLEAIVRNRVRQNPKVRFLEQHVVTGLETRDDGRRVVGVRVEARTEAPEHRRPAVAILAALVVDASGRDSRVPQWLEALGYPMPPETAINSSLAYASRWYRRPDEHAAGQQVLAVNGRAPVEPCGGVVFPVEGERWGVTLGGIGGVIPPHDDDGFLDFARALPQPAIYELIKHAEPLTPVAGYRRTENRLRHYERVRMPDGLVLVGDAVCAFNPVYGQGMTVGALGAELLAQMVGEQRRRRPDGDLTGLAARFQQRLAQVNSTPWLLATGADLSWPSTTGGRPRRTDRIAQLYLAQVLRLMAHDTYAYRAFLEVTHLLRSPAALFQPRIILGVLRQARHERSGAGAGR